MENIREVGSGKPPSPSPNMHFRNFSERHKSAPLVCQCMALLEDTLFGDLFNLNSNVEVPKRVGLGFSYPDIQVMVVMVNRASTEGSRTISWLKAPFPWLYNLRKPSFESQVVMVGRCWMVMMMVPMNSRPNARRWLASLAAAAWTCWASLPCL